MKLLAIDGNSIFSRAFYGIRPMSAPNGTPTNGIYGFISMMDKMQKELQPDLIAVAFDVHQPTFRHNEYPEYKAGRNPAPNEFHIQLPILQRVLEDMNIPVLMKAGFEADDILGTLSQMCKDNGMECCIYTGDKDSFQLVSDNVTVYLPKTTKDGAKIMVYDKAQIAAEFNGLEPRMMIDVKALQGDSSDNIQGVKGIGPKTAIDLISKFGSIESMYEAFNNHWNDASLISEQFALSEGVIKKLLKGKEDAEFSKFLGTIKTDVPLGITINDLCTEPYNPDTVYRDFCALGFNKFIKEWDLEPEEQEW